MRSAVNMVMGAATPKSEYPVRMPFSSKRRHGPPPERFDGRALAEPGQAARGVQGEDGEQERGGGRAGSAPIPTPPPPPA